jgi:hypothetical protein
MLNPLTIPAMLPKECSFPAKYCGFSREGTFSPYQCRKSATPRALLSHFFTFSPGGIQPTNQPKPNTVGWWLDPPLATLAAERKTLSDAEIP